MSRATVLGVGVDRLTFAETVERCAAFVGAPEPRRHVCVNAAKLVAVQDDPRLAAIVRTSDIVSADGQSVVWASKLLGDPLPERVAGIDLMHALLARAVAEGWSVFFLGASPAVLGNALDRLRERYPGLEVAGSHHGYFEPDEDAAVCSQIRGARPHILFVAMSSPKKEYWIDEHYGDLGVPLVVGVGGALDVAAGLRRRAPVVLQRVGLEWAFRLLQEPRRLLRRYATTNARFVALLCRHSIPRRCDGPSNAHGRRAFARTRDLAARLWLRARFRPTGAADLVRLGSGYGGWWLPKAGIFPGAIAYCAGAGTDISFDVALHERGCIVRTLDPTPRAVQYVSRAAPREERFTFSAVGLWDEDTDVRFYAPRSQAHASYSALNLQATTEFVTASVKTIESVMKDFGDPRIDILKMDIEGAETRVIGALLAGTVRPSVLLVEFDQPQPLRQTARSIGRLLAASYVLSKVDRWNYTFVLAES